jgi:PHP family Zn ribbon phosphoesterase
LETFRADLHIHTVLSPCAEIEMLPPLIVQEAVQRGIRLIAITDHNASANIAAVQQAALGSDLVVLPGMELQTREDVHVLCLFDTLSQIAAFQELVDRSLPEMENNAELFGMQIVVDSEGEPLSEEKRLLLTSTSLSIEQAFERTCELGGLLIPAHVDRKGFGLIESLGFVPEDLQIAALEISRHLTPQAAYQAFPQIRPYPLVQNGDAHRLDELSGSTQFILDRPSISEIRLALACQEDRSFTVIVK